MVAAADDPVTTTVSAACPHDCPDNCAMLVSVRDGRAVQVRGDPGHPFTQGGLCVKVNNYLDKTYSPGRVLYPLRRTGSRRSGRAAASSSPAEASTPCRTTCHPARRPTAATR